jgi:hypothetical protein
MNRRNSIRLHDIVLTDPKSKDHYDRLKSKSGAAALRDPDFPILESRETLTFPMPNGKTVSLECDPLLLAEFLVLQEDENSEKDCGEKVSFLSSSTSTMHGDDKMVSPASAASAKCAKDRKKSAIDEHQRIREALELCGVLLE